MVASNEKIYVSHEEVPFGQEQKGHHGLPAASKGSPILTTRLTKHFKGHQDPVFER